MSDEFWEEDPYYTGPPLTGEMVRGAEALLGVALPRTYLELLARRNGGTPRRRCVFTPFPTSWARITSRSGACGASEGSGGSTRRSWGAGTWWRSGVIRTWAW
nr:hypothetical protein GCM10017745_43940 [Saccharothrix mutabilis subsp. capreolus]